MSSEIKGTVAGTEAVEEGSLREAAEERTREIELEKRFKEAQTNAIAAGIAIIFSRILSSAPSIK